MDATFLSFVRDHLAAAGPRSFDRISAACGVPVSTIRKIHYGEVADPRVGTVQALHDFFEAGGLDAGSAPAEAA